MPITLHPLVLKIKQMQSRNWMITVRIRLLGKILQSLGSSWIVLRILTLAINLLCLKCTLLLCYS